MPATYNENIMGHTSCSQCRSSYIVNDAVYVVHQGTNPQQMFNCAICACQINENHLFVNSHGDRMCKDCYDSRYTRCAVCSCEVDRVPANTNDGGIAYYCQNHLQLLLRHEDLDRQYESSLIDGKLCRNITGEIFQYSYKPKYYYFNLDTESQPLYIGVEIEVESCHSHVSLSASCAVIARASYIDSVKKQFLYCKSDSSISDGFEIVSHPFTWKWYKMNRWVFTHVWRLRRYGYRSYDTNTCGMHVHLSKSSFTSLHLYKFLTLFYDTSNAPFITKASHRRSRISLEQWASIKEVEKRAYCAMWKAQGRSNRHTAVNINNHKTIEIRIFRGTLNRVGFERNIEFCVAAYDYTKDAAVGLVTSGNFIKYVMSNKDKYRHLSSWLRRIKKRRRNVYNMPQKTVSVD